MSMCRSERFREASQGDEAGFKKANKVAFKRSLTLVISRRIVGAIAGGLWRGDTA